MLLLKGMSSEVNEFSHSVTETVVEKFTDWTQTKNTLCL